MPRTALALLAFLPGCFFSHNFGSHGFGDIPLAPEARLIQVGFSAPSPSCQNLGPVFGATQMGASTTPTDVHIERALNDARNKAAVLGSNYLQTQQPQLKTTEYGTVGASILGVAYRCPPETPEAQAYAVGWSRAHAEAEKQHADAEKQHADALAAAQRSAPESAPPKLGATLAALAARNADRAKQLEAGAPNPPIKLDHVALDDVQVVRDFPGQPCTPLGAEQVAAPERSVVRGITQLRRNATDRHANLVVLDPFDDHVSDPVLFGRYYACPR